MPWKASAVKMSDIGRSVTRASSQVRMSATHMQMETTAATTGIRVSAAPELRPALVRALVGAGLDVLRVDRAASRLESIFLQLTQSKGPQA